VARCWRRKTRDSCHVDDCFYGRTNIRVARGCGRLPVCHRQAGLGGANDGLLFALVRVRAKANVPHRARQICTVKTPSTAGRPTEEAQYESLVQCHLRAVKSLRARRPRDNCVTYLATRCALGMARRANATQRKNLAVEDNVQEQFVDITSAHGAIPSFMVHPQGAGPWPAIILYMDAPGIREELRNMARKISNQGYVCVLPDLYHRYGQLRFDLPRRNDAMGNVIKAAYLSLTDADINQDTAGIIGFLDAQDVVKPGPIGTIGYCMSGRFVTTTALAFPARIVAAASLYGTRLVVDEANSPHECLAGIQAELYYGFGADDPYTPPDYIKTFTTALDAAQLKYEMDVFAGVDHGYCFVERAAYNQHASEQSWEKVFAMFKRTLA
jgi:carboxymethylenebutenolidase